MSRPRAQCFHVGEYLEEELAARGWTTRNLAQNIGGDIDVEELALEFLIHVGPSDPGIIFTQQCAERLGKAIDVHPQTLLNIDTAWREWFKSQ